MATSWNNLAPLKSSRIAYWAAMPYWHFSDVLFLSMGFDPTGEDRITTNDEEAAKTGHEYVSRYDMFNRAWELKLVDTISFPDSPPNSPPAGFCPLSIAKWAMNNFPSFPIELFNAVVQRFEENNSKTKTSPTRRKGYYFYGFTRLNQDSCTYWASITYWNYDEALLLSMGYDPNEAGVETDDETAWEIGNEYCRRGTMLRRAYELRHIGARHLDSEYTEEKIIVYLPEEFSRWASENLLSFPEELLHAVSKHKLKDAPNNNLQFSNQQSKLTMHEDYSSTSDTQGALCSINQEPANGVRTTDESNPSEEKPLKGNPGSDGRWSKRDEIVDKAVAAMRFLVDECHCKCRHDILANIVYEQGNDCKSFKDLDAKGYNLLKQFKMAALKIVPEERQFGNDFDPKEHAKPNPNKSKNYDPEACKCEINGHRNFKPQK